MSLDAFPVDEQDISFVLFDQLDIERLFEYEAFNSLSRDEVDMVLNEAQRFAKNDIWPTNAIADREGCTFSQGEVKVPECLHKVYKIYAENGWISLSAPEEIGGAGMPILVGVAVGEILSGANTAFATYPGLTRFAARFIARFGDDSMRETFVGRLYSGEWSGTMCLTEPQAGSAVGDIRTTAERKGDEYLISGSKLFITAGEHDLTPNIIHLVLARTPDAPKGIKGLSLFIVPKIWVEPDGSLGEPNDVTCSGIEEKMGIHAASTCTLNFGDNGRCRALILGSEGEGMKIMFDLMNAARIGCGVQGLCAGAVAYLHALDYAKERIQGVEIQNIRDFDAPRVPIIKHPDVKRMLFTMKAQVEGMRALLYRAAYYADLSACHPEQETRDRYHKLLELLTPICKAYCSDTGFKVTVMAIQTYGGYGYVKEHPIEQLMRDAKIFSIYEGANGIQALDLIGRKIPKNNGEYYMLLMDEIGATIKANQDHPVLDRLAERLEKEVGRVRTVTGRFAESGLQGDLGFPTLNATAYLDLLGNVILGWLLLDQAAIAHDKLSQMILDRGVDSVEARERLLAEDSSARYYDNKVKTAAFFIQSLLPENAGIAECILEGDQEILQVEL